MSEVVNQQSQEDQRKVKVMPKTPGRPKTNTTTLKSKYFSFLITGNTNQQMFNKYDNGMIEIMVSKLNGVVEETFGSIDNIKEVMFFVGSDEETRGLNFDEIVKQISVDSSIEIGTNKGALHFHVVLAIHTYHNLNFDLNKLSAKVSRLWGSNMYINVQKNVDSSKQFMEYISKQSRDI